MPSYRTRLTDNVNPGLTSWATDCFALRARCVVRESKSLQGRHLFAKTRVPSCRTRPADNVNPGLTSWATIISPCGLRTTRVVEPRRCRPIGLVSPDNVDPGLTSWATIISPFGLSYHPCITRTCDHQYRLNIDRSLILTAWPTPTVQLSSTLSSLPRNAARRLRSQQNSGPMLPG